ncbi:class I SAM-dependent methyltransferase [Ruegeria aquimaris]|uniref:Methyltransferase domain-containing protein n=1 Tax=Ruegeria aquimaris TaxID=2984333 RepID=A0ABT3AN12_9RHOB|nr:class I SAM-dependent methyltransferase [Ruegeria sp. XHP0148]MCV2890090.1 methyltransferase domain-containing protein [Ruegeria sp. XHP0148]
MTATNQDQAEYWGKSASGMKWLTFEEQIAASFAPVVDLLLDRAALEPGQRVLDIGCGLGDVTLAAARAVGPTGHALGVDISTPFLDRARQRSSGMGNVEYALADAQTEPFAPADRDAMISRFGMMFFSDNVAAFANIARALKPGGRMTFAAWGPLAGNPWFYIPHRAATDRLGQMPKVDRNAPGPLAFHDIDRVTGLMAKAGLADIEARASDLNLTPPGGLTGASALCTRLGPAARVLAHFDGSEADEAAIRDAVSAALEPYVEDGRVLMPATINLFQARRARTA